MHWFSDDDDGGAGDDDDSPYHTFSTQWEQIFLIKCKLYIYIGLGFRVGEPIRFTKPILFFVSFSFSGEHPV